MTLEPGCAGQFGLSQILENTQISNACTDRFVMVSLLPVFIIASRPHGSRVAEPDYHTNHRAPMVSLLY